ncbi:MAG TPA: translocation/assembly module TamB domain-containing protein [Candidatus Krumholzibacteria bacterium]|nr:translocation/assembly module TamB domain-containing protein [Candidatus Krumholzibacteria bacterium]HPD71124.1 translocation/assembly module TamB domain-containing protein [Candidatus Krumholzibacteria bacterium]HRY39176.1 translocation/assembly module TamB domain-containing protein [Candidatus Krumholzibacteria bacterium]
MARRRIRWPAILTLLLLAGGVVLLDRNPQVLAPFATRLVNRQLEARLNGHLRVGAYHVRAFGGLDAYDATLTVRGERGGLTLVAVDTLEIDFRLREVLGPRLRLRRLAMRGVEVYHNQPPATEPAAAADDEPRAIPRIEVDLVDVRNARIEIADADGRQRELLQDVGWRGGIRGDGERLRLVSRGGSVRWDTRRSTLDRLYGELTIAKDGVRARDLSALWNDGRVTVDGGVTEAGVAVAVAARGVSVAAVNDLVGLSLDFDAAGDVDCTVTAHDDTVRFAGDFSGRFEQWNLDAVRGEAVVSGGVAEFAVLRGGVGGAWFDGTLRVDARDPAGTVITIAGDARDLDLRAGLIPEVADLPRTAGHGRLEIVHTTADEATRVSGLIVDGEIEIMPFDTCRVDVWARGDSLHFRSVDLSHGALRARLAGTSDRDEVFAGWLDVACADLRSVPPGWGWPALGGRLAGQVALDGPLDALEAAGTLEFADLAVGTLTATTGTADVLAERVLGEDWSLSAATEGDGFALGGVPLGRYLLWTRVGPTSVEVDSLRTVHGDTVVACRGRADLSPGRADLNVAGLAIDFAGNEWRTDAAVAAAVGDGLVQVPRLRLVSDHGDFTASVDYRAADDLLNGRLEATNFDLDLLDPLLRRSVQTGGRATALVEVGGRPDSPTVTLRGDLVDARFPLARVDSLRVAAHLRRGTVTIDAVDVASEFGRVRLAGTVSHRGASLREFWPGASLDLDIEIPDGDWAFLEQFQLPALDRLAGRFRGDLHLAGTSEDPLVTGDLDSAPFHFQWLHLDRLTGTVRAEDGQLAFGDLRGNQDELRLEGRLELPLSFDLLAAPTTPPDGPFFGHLVVPAGTDLAPLLDATNAFSRCSGRGQADLIVSGPLSHPVYQGTIAVDDVAFVLRGNEEVYHDCRARGVFQDDLLIVQELRGQEGQRGVFTGSGSVTFAGLVLKTWDIAFAADRFLVASIPDLRALVRTDNGRLTGVPVGPDSTLVPHFTGDFELIRGRYTGNFAATEGTLDPTLGTVAPNWLADVRVSGPPRTARIVNRTMDLDLSGDVTVVRDADGMIIKGGMDIDNGRLPVFNNTFKVVRGRLDFSRAVGVVPNVDIDAETRVRLPSQVQGASVVELITVHATGPADAMEISYSSESGYPRAAIERMLLGLSPYPDAQGDSDVLANASISAGLNILEREIASEIGIFDTVEIEQIQRQQTSGETGLDPLIGVGKYVGTDLYITYAQGVNQNDRDLLIEYQITNHLLLQTEIRRRIDEYQGDATYNLDLKYRFEY